MSREGQTELRSILSAGQLSELRWPRFEDLQVEIDEFYSSVGYSFAWVRSSKASPNAKAMIDLLKSADRKGLEPEDYDGPRWRARIASLEHGNAASESDLLHFDVALTVSAMRYISDLHRGRLNPRSVHMALDVENSELDLSEFIRLKIVSASDVEAALADLEPPFPTYHRTIRALQSYLALANSGDGAPLPTPPRAVYPGETYSAMPRLTRLLTLFGDLPKKNTTSKPADLYERSLVAGVKKFQERHGLEPDGRIDSETVKALNVPLKHRITQLQLTLERFRWMPRRFSRPPIVVNIPEFRLRAVDESFHWVLSMKIVVGKAYGHQTPVFTSELRSITFRPSWNVPLRIQQDELLPQIEKDPSYLSENSYVVTDGSGTVVEAAPASSEVWEQLRSGELHLRQEPGPDNALGFIRFDLSDPFDIYLHGTPATELFSRSRRDFSHGCIRVEDPLALASWVLRDDPQWTSDSIRAAIFDEKTIRVTLERPIPVLIVYGTAVVMENGEIHFFDDIYGQDAVLERALAARYL
jgi:L,D-transpeptidase YcbB